MPSFPVLDIDSLNATHGCLGWGRAMFAPGVGTLGGTGLADWYLTAGVIVVVVDVVAVTAVLVADRDRARRLVDWFWSSRTRIILGYKLNCTRICKDVC